MTVELEQPIDFNHLYTLAEFESLNFPDDDNIYELLNGQIIMAPPPGDDYGTIAQIINRSLILFDPDERLGKIWQTTDFKLAADFSPAPDLAFIRADRVPVRGPGPVSVVPDLVVEVWSPSDLSSRPRRERNEAKVRKYQAVGVPLIWAIFPQARKVEVYHPDQPEPTIKGVRDELDGESSLPGFKLAVERLFK